MHHGAQRLLIRLLVLACFLAPMGAGLSLALHGQRRLVLWGVGLAAALPFVWHTLVRLPSAFLAAPATSYGGEARHPGLVVVFGFLVAAWQYACLAAWTWFVFSMLVRRGGMSEMALVWMSGAVLGPMAYMTCNDLEIDGGPGPSMLFAFAACLAMTAHYRFAAPLAAIIVVLSALGSVLSGYAAMTAARFATIQRRLHSEAGDGVHPQLGRDLHQAVFASEPPDEA